MPAVKKKLIVALSGGLDSAVTAALLLEQGWDVAGLTMDVFNPSSCASEPARGRETQREGLLQASLEARKVADFLHIPFFTVNLENEFQKYVIQPFCGAYLSGRTPNPCVLCNRLIKFGLLQKEAFRLGAEFFATGHYACISQEHGRYLLHKGRDIAKDQSYFLFSLQQQQLARALFPLGSCTKDEVRCLAAQMGMPAPERSESQDICFIPDQDYVRFLENEFEIGPAEGDIVHVAGQVLGHHYGIYRYTIGQRKGLGIAWPEPLYVIRLDPENRRVIVGEKEHLAIAALYVENVNWLVRPPGERFRCKCRIRYRHREAPAWVVPLDGRRAEILFDKPQIGVTPGQAAVFYSDDLVLGGGWIG